MEKYSRIKDKQGKRPEKKRKVSMKVIDQPNPINFHEIKFKRALIKKLISIVNCMILTSGFLHFYKTIDYCH